MISIIIPAHKEKKNIEYLVDVLSHLKTCEPVEIIVALSPESNDDFKQEIKEKANFLRCSKKGRASQMNEASKMANGDVFAF